VNSTLTAPLLLETVSEVSHEVVAFVVAAPPPPLEMVFRTVNPVPAVGAVASADPRQPTTSVLPIYAGVIESDGFAPVPEVVFELSTAPLPFEPLVLTPLKDIRTAVDFALLGTVIVSEEAVNWLAANGRKISVREVPCEIAATQLHPPGPRVGTSYRRARLPPLPARNQR